MSSEQRAIAKLRALCARIGKNAPRSDLPKLVQTCRRAGITVKQRLRSQPRLRVLRDAMCREDALRLTELAARETVYFEPNYTSKTSLFYGQAITENRIAAIFIDVCKVKDPTFGDGYTVRNWDLANYFQRLHSEDVVYTYHRVEMVDDDEPAAE